MDNIEQHTVAIRNDMALRAKHLNGTIHVQIHEEETDRLEAYCDKQGLHCEETNVKRRVKKYEVW